MHKVRFSDEWIQKVEDWVNDHAVMIERYNALLRYRRMKKIVQKEEFNEWEMDQFCELEGSLLNVIFDDFRGDWPGDDIDSEDWSQ